MREDSAIEILWQSAALELQVARRTRELEDSNRRLAETLAHLERMQAEMTAAQRLAEVGTLAAGVAHEINTPVQFVSDSVHFLRDAVRDVLGVLELQREVRRLVADGGSPEAIAQALAAVREAEEAADLEYVHEHVPRAFERCIDGLERVATIVSSLKEFAHPPRAQMAPADLNRAIQSTLVIARNEYKYVAELETDLGDVPTVTCHLSDINQVVLNLIVNAAHACADAVRGTDAKGRIRVATRAVGDDIEISVADTGCGIPEAIRGRVFELFFTTKEVGKGTGQGLALARSIVTEKHRGRIWFDSEVGVGTTFYVRLPIGS